MSPVPFDPARLARVYVLGLGLSGTAAARLLLARGIAVVAGDRRPAAELDLAGLAAADLALGSEPDRLPDGIDAVIVSPGVGADHPLLAAARRDGIPVAAEVELAAAFARGTLIGITGSNGKSTTTAMTGAMLRAAGFAVEVCGNIGVPLASVAEGADDRFLVVELSSFQLETIHRLRPRAAALLNLSPDHLDRHGSLAGYLEAKRRIFRNQTAEDTAVLNADDPAIAATPVAARRRFFSATGAVADGCRVVADRVVDRDPTHGESELFAVADVPLPGPHNLENAMGAYLAARACGVPVDAIRAGARSYRPLPHRMEWIG
ncbi:MAG: UDP-N-acetylmuramoyl-L-alanine--D-glutamate ligase, partial [Thermoanaerobaculia bacterium]